MPLLPWLLLLLLALLPLARLLLQNLEIARTGRKNKSKAKMPLGAGRRAIRPSMSNSM